MSVLRSAIVTVALLTAARAAAQPDQRPPSKIDPDGEPAPAPTPAPPPTVAPPPAPAPAAPFAPLRRGFALELGLGVNLGATPLTTGLLFGSLFGGFKIGRVIVGLGLQLSGTTLDVTYNNSSQIGTTGSIYLLIVSPGIRGTLYRSRDRRLELVGQLDVGGGSLLGDTGPGAAAKLGLPPGQVPRSIQHFVFALGPALRYWLHPQFALNASVLLRGDLAIYSDQSLTELQLFLNASIGLGVMGVL